MLSSNDKCTCGFKMILSKAGNIVDDVPLHDYENHHLSTIILLVITCIVCHHWIYDTTPAIFGIGKKSLCKLLQNRT